jgi:hypothetical protein
MLELLQEPILRNDLLKTVILTHYMHFPILMFIF